MTIRHTIQQEMVLAAVNTLKCHATADEIYAVISQEYPTIGRGTVYRNLLKLSEMGEIRKIEMPNGADGYDHLCTNHYHIRCIKCGKLFDVDMDYISDLVQRVNDPHGFDIIECDIVFKGVCPHCKEQSVSGQYT